MEEFWTAPERADGHEVEAEFAREYVATPRIVFSDSLESVAPGCRLVRRADGGLFRVKARTISLNDGSTSGARRSGYSSWCYFRVDTTAPKAPVVSADGTYVECATDNCPALGGVGVPGTFTFSPAPGDGDVVAYRWYLSGQASSVTVTPTRDSVSVTVTPTDYGFVTLVVAAQDSAGRFGAATEFSFRVSSTSSAAAQATATKGGSGRSARPHRVAA